MELLPKKEFLAKFPDFRSCPTPFFETLLSRAQRRSFPKDHPMYTIGDPCSFTPFVLDGEIRVYQVSEAGREITLYEVLTGETCILNASCILSGKTYPAQATSTQDGSLLLVPAETFRALMAQYEEMRTFLFSLLNRRLDTVIALVEEVAFGKMDVRLFDYLVEKSENNELHTTHQKIANELGTSREVVTRLLRDLEITGKVKITRNLIQLLQP